MSKNFIYKFILSCAAVLLAILWLLSICIPDSFGFFNLSWAIGIFSFIAGICYILKGLLHKNVAIMKKINIFIGLIFLIICVLSIVNAVQMGSEYILPIIAIIVTLGLLFSTMAVGGKKWDQGNNQNEGYKNYYERKKDEEKNK